MNQIHAPPLCTLLESYGSHISDCLAPLKKFNMQAVRILVTLWSRYLLLLSFQLHNAHIYKRGQCFDQRTKSSGIIWSLYKTKSLIWLLPGELCEAHVCGAAGTNICLAWKCQTPDFLFIPVSDEPTEKRILGVERADLVSNRYWEDSKCSCMNYSVLPSSCQAAVSVTLQ